MAAQTQLGRTLTHVYNTDDIYKYIEYIHSIPLNLTCSRSLQDHDGRMIARKMMPVTTATPVVAVAMVMMVSLQTVAIPLRRSLQRRLVQTHHQRPSRLLSVRKLRNK